LRMALVRARVFEEMKGLSGQVKADMARILTDGIARGLNPREVAINLTNQAGIETRRANRIARTEIPSALRRARLDEADEAK
ncbi:phage head morphogenesis protein, partial [Klebsiella aerogenes]|nr:phage head morphogenesis protein [Klebsiella aerogenes]